jgi:hypothetical protein
VANFVLEHLSQSKKASEAVVRPFRWVPAPWKFKALRGLVSQFSIDSNAKASSCIRILCQDTEWSSGRVHAWTSGMTFF